jgi:hypothetical protein
VKGQIAHNSAAGVPSGNSSRLNVTRLVTEIIPAASFTSHLDR